MTLERPNVWQQRDPFPVKFVTWDPALQTHGSSQIGPVSVQKSVERVLKRAGFTAPVRARWTVMELRNRTYPGRVCPPRIAVENGSPALGAKYNQCEHLVHLSTFFYNCFFFCRFTVLCDLR